MADQTLAQDGAVKLPSGQSARRRYSVRYKLAWRWRVVLTWTRYAISGRHSGVSSLVDFVVGNYIFRAIQIPYELTALGELLAKRCPECALEIGTCHGGTLFALTRLAHAHAIIVSVDLPRGRFGGGYRVWRKWIYQRFGRCQQQLHLLRGDSHSDRMLDRVKAALGGQLLDYLFIDGDHTYEGVSRDFEMYGPLVRKGGIVAFHDIAEHSAASGCEVSKFWHHIKSEYRYEEIIEDPAQGWCGIGVLYV